MHLGSPTKDALLALTTLSDSEHWAQWRCIPGHKWRSHETDRIPLLEEPTELIQRCLLA